MPLEWNIQVLGRAESTQDSLHEIIAQNPDLKEGQVVQALTQDGGRGRHGNSWTSPMGNLYMSVLLRPKGELQKAGEFGFVVAVALHQALLSYVDEDEHKIQLKWPNDVLVNGLKISGILLECEPSLDHKGIMHMVVGVGVNIFNAPDLATSLNDVAHEAIYVNKVRDKILDKLSETYILWQEKGFAPIRQMWLNEAYCLDEPITARLKGGSHQGVFKGLSEDGALVLGMEDGSEKEIHAAEVHF